MRVLTDTLKRLGSASPLASMMRALSDFSGAGVLNVLASSSGLEISCGITFDLCNGLALDVYRPRAAEQAPVIVFYWGGRWEEGDRSMYRFVGCELARKGFVVVIPNYRLYPTVRFPAFIEDSARAVGWVHARAADYGGDPEKIVLLGHSAGAYNAAMLALNPAYLDALGGSREWLRGMIGLGGPYDFLPLVDEDLKDMFGPPSGYPLTQPIHWADGSNPPLLLIESWDDRIVYPKNTLNLYAQVRANGGPVEKYLPHGLSHEMLIGVVSNVLAFRSDIVSRIVEFTHRVTDTAPAVDRAPRPCGG
ncbi:alpha/beta hydrolase [Acidihalobacter ferrooxydans]|uniref:BD-FAE-like domain-containing protein n=1 Tax=Acidihalobacter ferrooxydans TaxID=1765967 RepID=A0A1P8UGG6_9GAMM|nr:alpha/beta hydrolase [Acidihalobacter ferrooxydans]APZ42854.1 hypothetical protein BW247_06890 [Acidihalobacter ferrooxydans]